jgi:coenzyme Q-binding protein COQ10
MNTYHTVHRVDYGVDDMYRLVADVESYPQFVPLCQELTVRGREHNGTHDVLVADMTAAYKFIQETFTSRVTLDPKASEILVEYIDGPFRHMQNRWRFRKAANGGCDVDFFIAYEFRSHALQLLMGALFDKAFRKFVDAFEERARHVYGPQRQPHSDVTAS